MGVASVAIQGVRASGYLLLVLILAGCEIKASSGSDSVVDDDDDESPVASPLPSDTASAFQIVEHRPVAGSVEQSLVHTVLARFDQPLLAQTVDGDHVRLMLSGNSVAAALSYDADSYAVRLTPNAALKPDETYTVRIGTGLMSQQGESYGGVSWSFTTAGRLGGTTQATIDSCMSETDLAMLVAVNEARAEARQCGGSNRPAVPPLTYRCELDAAAQGHSDDMAANDLISHDSSDGATLGMRVDATGYDWSAVGENVAGGQSTVPAVMQGWLASSGHCSNLMSGSFTEFGQARTTVQPSTYGVYWTQNFAAPR